MFPPTVSRERVVQEMLSRGWVPLLLRWLGLAHRPNLQVEALSALTTVAQTTTEHTSLLLKVRLRGEVILSIVRSASTFLRDFWFLRCRLIWHDFDPATCRVFCLRLRSACRVCTARHVIKLVDIVHSCLEGSEKCLHGERYIIVSAHNCTFTSTPDSRLILCSAVKHDAAQMPMLSTKFARVFSAWAHTHHTDLKLEHL